MKIREAQRDFRGRRRRLAERGGSDTQTLRECLAWVLLMLAAVRAEIAKLTQEWRDTHDLWFTPPAPSEPRVLYFQELAAKVMRGAAWFFVLLEAAFSTALTIVLMSLPWWVALLVGIVLAALFAYGAQGLVISLLAKHNGAPRAALYRLLAMLVIVGSLWLALVTIAALIRSGSGDAWVANVSWAYGVSLGILNIITPVISGLLAAGASICGWSGALVARLAELERFSRDLESFHRGYSTPDGGAPASDGDRSKLAAVPAAAPDGFSKTALLIAVLALLLAAGPADAKYLFDDCSASVAREALWEARTAFLDSLETVAAYRRVWEWHHVCFVGDGWTAPASTIVRLHPLTVTDCVTPVLNAAEITFPHLADLKRRAAEQQCREKRLTEVARYQASVREATKQLRAAFSRPFAGSGPNCSSIMAVLLRASQQPKGTLSIVGSDALETCRAGLTSIPAPRPDVEVIVVLVPPRISHARDGAESFEHQRKVLLSVAPWIKVVPPWGLREAACQPSPGSVREASNRAGCGDR